MVIRIDRLRVRMCKTVPIPIGDTLAFVEDGDFLQEFTDCGLDDEDLQSLQMVITVTPTGGEVVPVSRNIRDVVFVREDGQCVMIRYVYLEPANTVLLLTAYLGEDSLHLTLEEAEESERYISQQIDYFRSGYRT